MTAKIFTRRDGFYDVSDSDGNCKERCRLELRLTDDERIELVFVEQPTGPLPKVDWPTVQSWLMPWYEQEDVINDLSAAIDCDDIEVDMVAQSLDESGWKLVRK